MPDVTEWSRDVGDAHTLFHSRHGAMARLVPDPTPGYKNGYMTAIEPGYLQAGHNGVHVKDVATGKGFLERWAHSIGGPDMDRRNAHKMPTKTEKEKQAEREDAEWAAYLRRKVWQDRSRNKDRER